MIRGILFLSRGGFCFVYQLFCVSIVSIRYLFRFVSHLDSGFAFFFLFALSLSCYYVDSFLCVMEIYYYFIRKFLGAGFTVFSYVGFGVAFGL